VRVVVVVRAAKHSPCTVQCSNIHTVMATTHLAAAWASRWLSSSSSSIPLGTTAGRANLALQARNSRGETTARTAKRRALRLSMNVPTRAADGAKLTKDCVRECESE